MMAKGLKYLGEKNWANITREERFFCMRLYMDVMGNGGEKRFIDVINRICSPDNPENHFDPDENWELGYEVCFFRDFRFQQPKDQWDNSLPLKRTFDLCLMSDRNIIIIEAKCAERFTRHQVEDFRKDREHFDKLRKTVPELKDVTITILGLVAGDYIKGLKSRNSTWLHENGSFDARYQFMTWEALANVYQDKLLLRAGQIYKK